MSLQPDRPSTTDQKQGQIFLPEKDWISNVEEWQRVVLTQDELESKLTDRHMRGRIVSILLATFTGLVVVTMSIFILQGFNAWGFRLDVSVLKWLGGATVGEVAGLLTIAINSLFRANTTKAELKENTDHRKKAKQPESV